MLFWTQPAPSGCPFPPKKAPLRGAAEVDKKPNFIEFYKISRLTWRRSFCTSQAPKEAIQDGGLKSRTDGIDPNEMRAHGVCISIGPILPVLLFPS